MIRQLLILTLLGALILTVGCRNYNDILAEHRAAVEEKLLKVESIAKKASPQQTEKIGPLDPAPHFADFHDPRTNAIILHHVELGDLGSNNTEFEPPIEHLHTDILCTRIAANLLRHGRAYDNVSINLTRAEGCFKLVKDLRYVFVLKQQSGIKSQRERGYSSGFKAEYRAIGRLCDLDTLTCQGNIPISANNHVGYSNLYSVLRDALKIAITDEIPNAVVQY